MQKVKYSTVGFEKHKQDFKIISKQHLAEAIRQYDHTQYGDGKDQWVNAVDKFGEWHHRLK